MNLQIEKDKVLAAADKCPQAKEVLKTLFPNVFEQRFQVGNVISFKHCGGEVRVLLVKAWSSSGEIGVGFLQVSNMKEFYCNSVKTARVGEITAAEIDATGWKFSDCKKLTDTYDLYAMDM